VKICPPRVARLCTEQVNTYPRAPRGLTAPLALPAGFGALLAAGAAAAALHGRLPGVAVLILASAIVATGCAVAELAAAPLLAVAGWLTSVGFSGAPYGQLRPAGPLAVPAAIAISSCAVAGTVTGLLVRRAITSFRLRSMDIAGLVPPHRSGTGAGLRRPGQSLRDPLSLSGAIGTRRLLGGVLLVAGLPLLTIALTAARRDLGLADDLLFYLVAVVAVAVVGGFWPAVLAAVTASLLLNWYFTTPLHTLTIDEPRNVLALMLFVTVAVTVSSVVHLAARRAVQAARSAQEAAALLALAQTVLGGADTPTAVLEHLTGTWQGRAELAELSVGEWVRVAAAGSAPEGSPVTQCEMRDGLMLAVAGQPQPLSSRMLNGFAAQAAAALDRDRLRTQAAQAEALAEGNRMRAALLAAVSHDLRTPLASIKASVSTLRQTDVQWTPADEAALLATIEQSADRLNALIGNLLDASRLSSGALQPFLRSTAIDEVAPVALRGLDGGADVQLMVPDGLPLVWTDPGLLERVLANLFANALTYSPPGQHPSLRAQAASGTVILEIIDHGRGVPDELKAAMFEPFERLEARGTGTGVGLGLAVVKGFLDAMGGSVTAADTPGGGLTMRVTLPAAEQPASTSVPASP
jgi:two-component system, OmpR family, sensor histidine kinase KdpD